MKVGENFIWKLIKCENNKYVVPEFQRIYTWDKKNWEELWEDIQIIDINKKPYFLGIIVCVQEKSIGIAKSDNENEFLLIDGHQRFATLLLLNKALILHCKKINSIYKFDTTKCSFEYQNKGMMKKIHKRFEKSISLNEIPKKGFKPQSVFDKCLYFFYNKLAKECNSDDNIIKLNKKLNRLLVSTITLDNDESPQNVFDSLNSKGKALNDFERINNFVILTSNKLKNKDTKRDLLDLWEQTTYMLFFDKYKIHNKKIKKLYNASFFIRSFFILYFLEKIGINKIYFHFKKLYQNTFENLDTKERYFQFIKSIFTSTRLYLYIIDPFNSKDSFLKTSKKKEICELIMNILTISHTVIPLLLLLMVELEMNKNLTENGLLKILRIIYSYIMRRAICDLGRNQDDAIVLFCKCLIKMKTKNLKQTNNDAMFLEKSSTSIIDVFEECFKNLTKIKRFRFPNNEEFKKALLEQNFKNREDEIRLLLFGINSIGTPNLKYEDLSIEHIFPRNPNKEYKKKYKDDLEFFNNNLDNIGNLSLLSIKDNSSASNKPMDKKIGSFRGDNKGGLYINYYFHYILKKHNIDPSIERFTPKIFKIRREWLINLALEAWPVPSFLQYINDSNMVTLILETRNLHARAQCNILENEKGNNEWKDFLILVKSLATLHSSTNDKKWNKKRDELLRKGVIRKVKNTHYEFVQNCSFSSPSLAAAFITGYNMNGLISWKLEDNKELTLKNVLNLSTS